MDAKERQKRQEQIQSSQDFSEVFGKLVSGNKSGYKTVIEKSKKIEKCVCGTILEGNEKFCPECGTKIDKKI